VGAWPLDIPRDAEEWKTFSERIEAYMLKAIREAKENTSWINRNSEYEGAVSSFVKALLTPDAKNRFLADFVPFQQHVARIGLWNSLGQTLLKLTCPGVPDIYQGNDLWDFSLVDPDNRRPVDFDRRQQIFQDLRHWGIAPAHSHLRDLLETPKNGQLKLYLTWKTLCFRQQQPDLFQQGEYIPLAVEGARAGNVVAFARKSADSIVIVIVPRQVAELLHDSDLPPIGLDLWGDTRVVLPFQARNCHNVFTGEVLALDETDHSIAVGALLRDFPVALAEFSTATSSTVDAS
jgi:(1->4)-alpha-D-glucan 1-alpha-D-glucosylmutase